MPRGSDDQITRDVLVGVLDILANALASTSPLNERTDLAEAVTNLRTKAERIDAPRGRKAKENDDAG